jgi:hypothetical protein
MQKNLTAFLLYFMMAAITVVCLYLSWFIIHMGREGLIDWAVQLLQKKHLQGKIETIYHNRSHSIIKVLSVVLLVVIGFGWFLVLRNRKKIVIRVHDFLSAVTQVIISFFKHSVPKETSIQYSLFAIILFAVCRGIYCIITVPVSFDEADTWLLFISKGPVMISSFYPFPNNHILYNWCVWVCSILPINTTVLLRLPLIVALPPCIIFLYRLAKHLFNEQSSLLSVAVFTFSFPVFHYSYTARGYLFILLFSLVALWCLVMLDSYNKKRYRFSLVASLVAGFYTVPSFLYFAALALVFFFIRWFIKDRPKATMLMKHSIVVIIITLLLYTPVFLVSGTKGLFDYSGRQFAYAEMQNFIQLSLVELVKYLFGRSLWHMIAGGSIFLLLLLYGLLFNSKNKWFYLLSFAACLLPILIFFLQRQPFPARAWVHLLIFVSLIAATPGLWIRKKALLLTITTVVILVRFYPGFHERHLQRNGYDIVVKQVANRMMAESRNTLYINESNIKPLFDFYFQSSHFPATIYLQKGLYQKHQFDATVKYSAIIWHTNDPNNQLLKFPYDTVMVHKDIIVLFAK